MRSPLFGTTGAKDWDPRHSISFISSETAVLLRPVARGPISAGVAKLAASPEPTFGSR
jgi:hypothetical protein